MINFQNNMKTDNIVIWKRKYTVGMLLRGAVRRFFDEQKFINGHVGIEYTESKGFLDSDFYLKVTGHPTFVKAWYSATDDRFESEEE